MRAERGEGMDKTVLILAISSILCSAGYVICVKKDLNDLALRLNIVAMTLGLIAVARASFI